MTDVTSVDLVKLRDLYWVLLDKLGTWGSQFV